MIMTKDLLDIKKKLTNIVVLDLPPILPNNLCKIRTLNFETIK